MRLTDYSKYPMTKKQKELFEQLKQLAEEYEIGIIINDRLYSRR